MARFVGEIAFNRSSVYVRDNVNITPVYISLIVISGGCAEVLPVSLHAMY
jgi:hypothetical protein